MKKRQFVTAKFQKAVIFKLYKNSPRLVSYPMRYTVLSGFVKSEAVLDTSLAKINDRY